MKILALAFLLLTITTPVHASEYNLMPWPSLIEKQQGVLRLDQWPQFQLKGGDRRVRHAIAHFSEQLSLRTGVPLPTGKANQPGAPTFLIECGPAGLLVQALEEDESYQLIVDDKQIHLSAPNPLGILRGVETVLQLVQADMQGWVIPAVRIEDSPRFPWRGLTLDVARHFIPLEIIKRNIDGMAAVKLNVL